MIRLLSDGHNWHQLEGKIIWLKSILRIKPSPFDTILRRRVIMGAKQIDHQMRLKEFDPEKACNKSKVFVIDLA